MKLDLNLATRSYINRRALFLFYAVTGAVLVLILILQASLYLRLRSQERQVTAHLAELTQKAESARGDDPEPSPSDFKRLREEIDFANDILVRDGFRWTVLFDRLEEVVRDGVRVSSIQPDFKSGELRLTGMTRGIPELRAFLNRIISSPDFEDVYLLTQSRTAVKDTLGAEREAVAFTMTLKGAFQNE